MTNETIGQKTSDFFAKLVRSWSFVIFQIVSITLWITANGLHMLHFDPYPFDMLKLILTVEASFMGSMILMSQNRQANIDRKIIHEEFITELAIKKEVDQILTLVSKRDKASEIVEILKREKLNLDRQSKL